MFVFIMSLGLSISFLGTELWTTAVLEWLSVLLFINFFGILSLTNEFYDSIHPDNDKPPQNIYASHD